LRLKGGRGHNPTGLAGRMKRKKERNEELLLSERLFGFVTTGMLRFYFS